LLPYISSAASLLLNHYSQIKKRARSVYYLIAKKNGGDVGSKESEDDEPARALPVPTSTPRKTPPWDMLPAAMAGGEELPRGRGLRLASV
jgi:hypothetical protein